MKHRVAIILINWNSFEVTNACIHSLKKSDYPFFTTVVVDNGSMDGSADQLEALHPDIILIRSATNLGFTGGNNLGLRYSLEKGFTYSMMLNNDTFVEPGFLTPLVQFMDETPDCGIIQPRIHFNHNRVLLWDAGSYYNKWLGWFYTTGLNRTPKSKHLTLKKVDWVTGCGFLTRNSILQQTGLLVEKMFIYSEDVDLSLRIHALGYDLIYHPDSVIYHIAGMSNKSKVKGKEGYVSPIVQYLNQRNRIWVLKKYTPWYCVPTAFVFNFFYIALVLGYFAARGRFGKLKAVGRALKDGLTDSIKN